MEKKWGDIKKPHWRPALRKVGSNISSVYRDPKLKKIVSGLFDEHNVTWKKEDANKFDTIRLHDLEEFKEFQEKIWK
jgi:predicted phage-related endonuclease